MIEPRPASPSPCGRIRRLCLAASLLLPGACAPITNFVTAPGPRYEGRYARPATLNEAAGTPVRVVSFNVRFSREIGRALTVLESDSLREADVLALQEMDTLGVERIARTLGLNYAYYPASIHPASGKYFGPAVLSRWPIERSWKLVLPHGGWTRGQRRTATAAIVRIGATRLLVYAVHLETPFQITDRERRDQAMAIVRDAARYPGPVVIAGDFNTPDRSRGYRRLTGRFRDAMRSRWAGPTYIGTLWKPFLLRIDHVFVPRDWCSAHAVRFTLHGSDHRGLAVDVGPCPVL